MTDQSIRILNELSDEMNALYGYVIAEGDNFGEPAINSGPCGAFANLFYNCWNRRFEKKVSIAFVMVQNGVKDEAESSKDPDECWHVLIRLPNGLLFDGGFGVHDEKKYKDPLSIEDMKVYDLQLLDKRSYGLERDYPRYCPTFSKATVTALIERCLEKIDPADVESSSP